MSTKSVSSLAVLCVALFAQSLLAQITPVLPVIATNNVFNITAAPYNATTGSADNAAAIQAAIVAAAAASGGGTVEIPSGTFMSGPISFRSHVNLQLDAGATLKFLAESSYPNATGSPAYPISGTNLTDVEISGSGTIDGNGAGWWSANPPNRPYMIYLNKTQRVLIQGVTLQNPPKMHVVFKNWMGNVTIQNVTINTINSSPNTDGIDLIGTNCLIQNCFISGGDDNIAIGSSTATAYARDILVTNCIFGYGHGVSLGSNTAGGVSNLTVINCVWTNTDFGIRMKSDDATTGGSGQGGIAQSLNYLNLSMTNVGMPLLIFSYYNSYYPPQNDVPAAFAATQSIGTVLAPVWENIVISNLTAKSCGESLIWARPEAPATNITLIKYKTLSATSGSSYNFGIYNAYGVSIIDSPIATASGKKTFSLYNAGVTFSNTTAASAVTMDGLTASNSLALYNAPVNLSASDLYGANPISVSGCILSNNTSLTLPATTVVNFALGTAAAKVGVNGSLTLNGPTLNITAGGGFGAGTYTLFSYTSSSASITPVLGTTPSGYNYTLTNNTAAKQVNLIVTSTNVVSGTSPAVTNQPASQSFYAGQNATLVAGANGTAPLAYQWYFNTNTPLPAATNLTLALNGLQPTNAGGYTFVVTNAYGAATSAVATLAVALPPQFAATTPAIGSVVIAGNGGLPGSNYVVLASTNLTLPSSQWTRLATNPFDGSGNFTFTNSTTASPRTYFRLQLP
jgi:polygalacturonase